VRNLVITLATTLAISGCATAPTVARDGNLAMLKGKSLAPLSSQSAPSDAALAKSIEAGVLKGLAANGADVSSGKPPAYLLQVGVGVSAPTVGISSAAGPSVKETAWRSKPAAWASVRADRDDPELMAQRLVQALAGAGS
jgi:hypothetical protein